MNLDVVNPVLIGGSVATTIFFGVLVALWLVGGC